ncbi:MAG: Beta-lactamase domain protein [Thermotogales bacterium 46_20]|nr:MAG: Beta-lactamase domain protein [Thermotogales bacterium 46_20]
MVKRFVSGLLDENTYIVELQNRVFVIDPGEGAENFIVKLVGQRKVTVLLTHAHIDHFCALQRLDYDCVYLHALEKESLLSPEKHLGYYLGLETLSAESDKLCSPDSLPEPWKYIHTPGHTPGSVCYELEDGILFTGDTVFSDSVGRTDLPGGSTIEMQKTLISLKKYFAENPDIRVLPGHGPEAKASKILVSNPFFRGL